MDAGVPIKKPVAGVAMGLISNEDKSKISVLTDIQGLEDFFGDMDFKVAGTVDGITAIQMDIKIKGINEEILRKALAQARKGRLFILDKMLEVINQPSAELSKYAPKIVSFSIDPNKIKDVIGSGGKVINKIIDETGVKIDIDDYGNVLVSGIDSEMNAKAKKTIELIANDPEIDEEFDGKVVRIMNFGAFVEIAPGKDAMIHISKLKKERVEKVEDVVNIGDKVRVKVIDINEKGVALRLLEVLK